MKAESDKIKAMTARHPGIVVPIDVEALCVGKDPGNIFEQPAFNFEDLRKAPYLSGTASLDGTTNLTPGVHLHWALPDAITKGRQTADQLNFPAVPDRWLITRIFCDTDKKVTPRAIPILRENQLLFLFRVQNGKSNHGGCWGKSVALMTG